MEVILKKPSGCLLYYNGNFEKLVRSLPKSFGFNESEYTIKILYNSTFDGGYVKKDDRCVLTFNERERKGKNVGGLKDYLEQYKSNFT